MLLLRATGTLGVERPLPPNLLPLFRHAVKVCPFSPAQSGQQGQKVGHARLPRVGQGQANGEVQPQQQRAAFCLHVQAAQPGQRFPHQSRGV